MRRPGHVLILDCFGELALVLAVHVFSGLDAPGLFVPGVELDPRDRGSSEEIAEVVRPPARACDLFRLELRRRDLGFLGGMYPKLDPYPVKRCVWVDVLLPLFVAFFVDDRLIRGLLPAELERAPALFVDPIAHFFALDVKLALGFEGEAVELVIRLVALEIEADVYAGWVVLRESLLKASTMA